MNVATVRLMSRVLFMPTDVTVLLPQKLPEGKCPVLWLLHGATCDYDDFLQKEHVPEMLRGHEVMVVMPSGLNSDFANHMEFGGGFAYTDFLMDELMPYIYNYFPASDHPKENFLAGFSMGGAAEGRVPKMLFCCGDQDGCFEKVKEFRKAADGMGANTISYEYIPGYGHDRADVTIQKAIEWFGI